jgi:hypothetical protein
MRILIEPWERETLVRRSNDNVMQVGRKEMLGNRRRRRLELLERSNGRMSNSVNGVPAQACWGYTYQFYQVLIDVGPRHLLWAKQW